MICIELKNFWGIGVEEFEILLKGYSDIENREIIFKRMKKIFLTAFGDIVKKECYEFDHKQMDDIS